MSLQFFQSLISQLEEEDQLYEELIQLLEEEKHIIIQNKRTQLTSNIQQQELLFNEINDVETQRVEMLNQFANSKNIPFEKLSLPRLVPMIMHPQIRHKLQYLQKSLKNKTEEIKYLGELNRTLIQQAVAFIDLSLDLFSDVINSNQDKVYSPYGAINMAGEGHQMLNYNA
jgi:ABC-type phosphate transport system auxiliary subunit